MKQANEIIETLHSLGDEERREVSKIMYPSSMEVLGVKNPDLRLIVKEVHGIMKNRSRKEYMDLAMDLIHSGIIECQMFAWLLLEKAKIIITLSGKEISELEGVLDNWVSIDTFGTIVYGVNWRLGVISDDEVFLLQENQNVWYRRLALVATVALNLKSRGGTGDTSRTLAVCGRAVTDHHDMIVKALSWALRSLIRWNKPAVGDFLQTHQSDLHNRVIREVSHKLEFGTKN